MATTFKSKVVSKLSPEYNGYVALRSPCIVGYVENNYHMSKFNDVAARCQVNERVIRPDYKDVAFA